MRFNPPEKPRVAPTHKISDDSPYPASQRPSTAPPSAGPVSYAPPSMPPPADSSARTSDRRAPPVSGASGSLVVPARPMALIVIVVLVDIALAAAGTALLVKGLAKPEPAPASGEQRTELPAEPTKTAAARMETPPAHHETVCASSALGDGNASTKSSPASAGNASGVATKSSDNSLAVTAPAKSPPAGSSVTAKSPSDPATRSSAAKSPGRVGSASSSTSHAGTATSSSHAGTATSSSHAGSATSPTSHADASHGGSSAGARVDTVPSSPIIDPEIDFAPQVDQKSARSKAAFDRCVAAAGTVHGAIEIIFDIQRDGSVSHAGAGENTTGNAELASCLANVIEKWKLTPHQGASAQFVKSFIYP